MAFAHMTYWIRIKVSDPAIQIIMRQTLRWGGCMVGYYTHQLDTRILTI